MFKYFTVTEANSTLPAVRSRFKDALQRREAVERIEHKLQAVVAEQEAAGGMHRSSNSSSNSSATPLKDYVELKQELNCAMTELYRAISLLEETGVSLKGLDSGMVDFPSRRFDQDVWLCWKYDEDAVKFWHEIDAGFMGRKPIEVSDESLV